MIVGDHSENAQRSTEHCLVDVAPHWLIMTFALTLTFWLREVRELSLLSEYTLRCRSIPYLKQT